ncbi:DUF2171 domain-containing protein [Sphingomonas crocodyli]|uniref:DUF2171 domain-containing protein n=1 Tax=Sphingomonas crocodyli TaxID=1979270 RepID=A0A437M055_9SPHN|nr:DUF2171 domain-containing protein [Sphingomonas crocodyli]RVT91028.1 DUF2171 domain-containing protein [Sphingomonas crocodyli]
MGYERYGRRDNRYDRDPRDRDPRYGRDAYGYRERSDYGRGDYGRPPRDYDYDDRGFFDRAGDEVRSWFGDEDAERRRRWDERIQQREYERRYGPGSYEGARAGFTGYDAGYSPYDVGFGYQGDTYGVGRGAGATSTFGLGGGASHDGWGRDPNYANWRRRQLAELDRDYDDYRRENQSRFNDDFGSWRTGRAGQRSSLNQVQEHQEVVGSDGQHVGTVDHVRGDKILLTKTDKDAGGHHHSIPSSWIVSVADKVTINRTAAQAKQAWKDEERNEGPHNLNRAFSGTY